MVELIKYDEACRAVAEAARIDEVKDVKDRMKALAAYAKEAHNRDMEANAWAIRKRAEDRLGELSLQIEKAHKIGPGIDVQLPSGGKSKKEVLADHGISTSAAQRYEQFHQLPEWERRARIKLGEDAIRAGKSIADAMIRQKEKADEHVARERQLGERICALPTKKYGVIYTDLDLQFRLWSGARTETVLNPGDIIALAAEHCACLAWATQPRLREALEILESLGFEYKSHFVWAKDRIGPGYWSRNKHEILLLTTIGNPPCPAPGEQWDSVIEAPRKGHGEKPELVYELIEQYWPSLPKVAVNLGGLPRKGWDGLQAAPHREVAAHAAQCRA